MFEKKNGKRFLASVMALVMLLSLAPVGALAADETPTNKECSGVALPAAEDDNKQTVADEDNTPTPQPAVDLKPVVDTPENGETTNSDTENGVANLPLLDENRPVADNSEAVILREGELFDQDFGVNPPEPREPSTQYERLYVTILNGTEFPNEPGFSHKHDYDFVK